MTARLLAVVAILSMGHGAYGATKKERSFDVAKSWLSALKANNFDALAAYHCSAVHAQDGRPEEESGEGTAKDGGWSEAMGRLSADEEGPLAE